MKIVVAIDGSEHADRALAWAAHESQLRSAALTALYAISVTRLARPANRDAAHEQEHAAGQQLVRDACARVGVGDDEIRVDVPLITGRGAAAAVLHHTQDADLVVLGSRGLGGFPGLLLGSVSQQVAAYARIPVAVIPAAHDTAADAMAAASIVVGVDGSTAARRALQWGAEEARLRGIPLQAISVRPSPDVAVAGATSTPMYALEEQAQHQAQRTLAEVVEDELGHRHGTVRQRVMTGRPAHVLTDEAATPPSILVVGSRGRGGFAGLLLGSVSQQCLTHARSPVVVIHA